MQSRILLVAILTGYPPVRFPISNLLRRCSVQSLRQHTRQYKSCCKVAPIRMRVVLRNPALLIALSTRTRPAVRAMLARGADPNVVDRHGSTALRWAVGPSRPTRPSSNELVKRGVDPERSEQYLASLP